MYFKRSKYFKTQVIMDIRPWFSQNKKQKKRKVEPPNVEELIR